MVLCRFATSEETNGVFMLGFITTHNTVWRFGAYEKKLHKASSGAPLRAHGLPDISMITLTTGALKRLTHNDVH